MRMADQTLGFTVIGLGAGGAGLSAFVGPVAAVLPGVGLILALHMERRE